MLAKTLSDSKKNRRDRDAVDLGFPIKLTPSEGESLYFPGVQYAVDWLSSNYPLATGWTITHLPIRSRTR